MSNAAGRHECRSCNGNLAHYITCELMASILISVTSSLSNNGANKLSYEHSQMCSANGILFQSYMQNYLLYSDDPSASKINYTCFLFSPTLANSQSQRTLGERHTTIILQFKRLQQEDCCEFEASLGYTASSWPASTTE